MQRTSGDIEKKNRNGSHYVCVHCVYRDHADVNSAKYNIFSHENNKTI
jgi:transposase